MAIVCSYKTCTLDAGSNSLSYCSKHWLWFTRNCNMDREVLKCTFENCNKPQKNTTGYCDMHLKRIQRNHEMDREVQLVFNHSWKCAKCGRECTKKTYGAKNLCENCYSSKQRYKHKYKRKARDEHRRYLKYRERDTIVYTEDQST